MKYRDLLRRLEEDGWRMVRSKGSHRQLKHDSKPGTVTVAGHPGDEVPPGTLKSILRQAQLDKEGGLMRYAIIIEDAGSNFGAYAPDVPGVGVTAPTVAEVIASLRDALVMHFEGLAEDGVPIPLPSAVITDAAIEVEIPAGIDS